MKPNKKSLVLFYPFAVVLILLIITTGCNTPTPKDQDKTSPKTGITVIDTDGNVYHTVTIGKQVWMVENLKTAHFRNGDTILNVSDELKWSQLKTAAFCNYNNDKKNITDYGRLYNWFAVNDKRSICPTGWHVPTNSEWSDLFKFLDGKDIAAGKLKSTDKWHKPNAGATNSKGFTALPGGSRDYPEAKFDNLGSSGHWWSATENEEGFSWMIYMSCMGEDAMKLSEAQQSGFSVRCIKD